MKNIFKRLWLKNIILFSFFAVILLLSFITTTFVGYKGLTMWDHLAGISYGFDYSIFSTIIIALNFINLGLFVITIFVTIFKKKNLFNYMVFVFSTAVNVMVILYPILFGFESLLMIVVAIINIILLLFSLFIVVLSRGYMKSLDENNNEIKDDEIKTYRIKPFWFLILDIIALIILITVFFIPLYVENTVPYALIETLGASFDMITGILFLIMFLLYFGTLTYFIFALSSYFYNKKEFYQKSRNVILTCFIICLVFFLLGYFIKIMKTTPENPVDIYSYIPVLIMLVPSLIYSILYGMSHGTKVDEKKSKKKLKLEPLIFVTLITSVTVLSLFFNIMDITFEYGSLSYSNNNDISLTGISLLTDYKDLGGTYQVLSFLLIFMLISSGVGFFLSLTSFFAKYSGYAKISKIAIYVNFIFIFLFAIAGYYFSIAQEINKEMIQDLVKELFNVTLDLDYKCTIETGMIYALVIDVVLIAIMYITRGFEENKATLQTGVTLIQESPSPISNNSAPSSNDKSLDENEIKPDSFDPCPAFTEIDNDLNMYRDDLINRLKYEVKGDSLKTLVNFVVDYARNSRLHLSYRAEDIATFISGLGSTRLSILQGMSGTGKTSLPKIFTESLFGNCFIVEVESSWKDKNELLGYYNEFSRKYTPKKFTQALYKACLNPEIPTLIVLDEMNLSRIEYYFSDFLSLMENEEDKREIKLVNIKLNPVVEGQTKSYLALERDHTIKIPRNVWFIGTANRDESTFVISDKVYDRAYTMNFNKRAPKVTSYGDPIDKKFLTYEYFNQLLTDAKAKGKFNAEDNQIIKQVEALLQPYNISFGNRILNQIENFVNIYVTCFEDMTRTDEAVETILLSKVVSKLEVKVVDDKEKLARDFEAIGLFKCKDFVLKLNED